MSPLSELSRPTVTRGAAAGEQPGGRPAAGLVPVIAPPQHPLAAGLVHRGGTPGLREAEVDRHLPRRDVGVGPVPDDAAGLVLVEPQVQERPDELPDCDIPGATTWDAFPFSGLSVSLSSRAAYRKNETMSRVAASPIPRTSESFAVQTSSYR